MRRAFLILTLLTACGGPANVTVQNDITIHIVGETDALPFDPRGARLQAATAQLSQLAGHPIQLEIDAALANEFRADFEHQLIDAIEHLARALAAFREESPDGAPRTFAALQRVHARYVSTAREPRGREGTFDVGTGVLQIDSGAHPSSLVPFDSALDALVDENDAYETKKWADKTADSIPAGERRAYFEFVTRGARHSRPALDERRVARDVVRLDQEPELHAKTHAWLIDNAERHSESPEFGAWLSRELPKLTPKELGKISRALYSERVKADGYPGVDRFQFGITIADSWIRAGKPIAGSTRELDDAGQLYDDVLCPTGPANAAGKHDRSRSCTSAGRGWMSYVASDPARVKRLATALDERNDYDLAMNVFYSIRAPAPDPFSDLLHALDVRRKSWAAGTDVLAFDRRGKQLEEEANYLWKTNPDKRGTAVFLLSKAGINYTGSSSEGVVWRGFSRSYGAPIDAAMLASMLDHGRPALVEVPQVWPALAPGFSRADVVLPRFDALVPDASLPASTPYVHTLSEIITHLCKDRNAADLAKVHAWTARRVSSQPAERATFTILERDTAPGGCAGRVMVRD